MGTEPSSLNPLEAQGLLARYGIIMPPQALVQDEGEAIRLSEELGPPVALKLVTRSLLHLSDIEGVLLGLSTHEEVREGFRRLRALAERLSLKLEGILVQRMVKGAPEFILGARRDPTFGPLLLFGLGGLWAELYRDYSICLHPWSDDDLKDMVEGIRGKAALEGYRGRPGVDKGALIELLRGLGRMMLDNPLIREVDLNPIIPDPSLGLVAVDAKVILGASRDEVGPIAFPTKEELLPLFEPKSIAIVGASEERGKVSGMVLPHLLRLGFPRDRLYPVNPKREKVLGLRCYPSLKAIEGPIDLACLLVPPRAVEEVLQEAGERKVRASIIFSSGFAEVGEEGAQARLKATARRYSLRFCGPNSEGIVSPSGSNYSTFTPALEAFPQVSEGGAAIVAQSGAVMSYLLTSLLERGCGISRAISTGNEADLDFSDYLHFLAQDVKTKAIGGFLEGVREGRKFIEALKELARAGKPLVLMKVGRSELGAMAASSHTGALAGDYSLYRAIFRQLGVMEAKELEEVVDLLIAFTLQPLPSGDRLVIVSASGGANSLLLDLCQEEQILPPPFSTHTTERLRALLPGFATPRNPLDLTGQALADPRTFEAVLECIVEEGDLFLVLRAGGGIRAAESLVRCRDLFASKGKVLLTCFMTSRLYAQEAQILLMKHGIPTFTSPSKALRAAVAMIKYARFLRRFKG